MIILAYKQFQMKKLQTTKFFLKAKLGLGEHNIFIELQNI